jgi:membrane-associated phospholipid phosphatase
VRRHLVTIFCIGVLFSPVVVTAQSTNSAPFVAPRADSFWKPFTQVPGDVKRFVSKDTLKIFAPAAVGALFGSQFDHESIDMALSRLQPQGVFTAGNIGGGFYAQTGGAFALYTIGFVTKSERIRAIGSDLVRSQILTQLSVQTAKMAVRRERPDYSDNMSLPSGHTAGAFATATVLHRHFGWKVGVPAYAAGAYVASSRMSANKHHLSDVIMGAAFGIAAAHTVTIGSGNARFDMGVSPTQGGGVVTFTKK